MGFDTEQEDNYIDSKEVIKIQRIIHEPIFKKKEIIEPVVKQVPFDVKVPNFINEDIIRYVPKDKEFIIPKIKIVENEVNVDKVEYRKVIVDRPEYRDVLFDRPVFEDKIITVFKTKEEVVVKQVPYEVKVPEFVNTVVSKPVFNEVQVDIFKLFAKCPCCGEEIRVWDLKK